MATAAAEEFAALSNSTSSFRRHPADTPSPPSTPSRSPSPPNHSIHNPHPASSTYTLPRYTSTSTSSTTHTGPKGVLADAASFFLASRSRKNLASSTTTHPTSSRNIHEKNLTPPQTGSCPSSSDEDDEEFMAAWRTTRLAELSHPRPPPSRRRSPTPPTFTGQLTPVSASGYLDAIEHALPPTLVLVYISDCTSEVSAEVEEWVVELARKYTGAKWVKLEVDEAEMEAEGVPALLAYKAGELVWSAVPLLDVCGEGGPEGLEAGMRAASVL